MLYTLFREHLARIQFGAEYVSNYIPNKFIIIDDKDPPWMNEYILRKIMNKKLHVSLLIRITKVMMPT